MTVAYAEARSREKVEQARADEVAAMARAEAETRIFELQTMYVDGAECDFGIAQAGAELFILPSVLSTRPIPTQAKVVRYNLRGPNT